MSSSLIRGCSSKNWVTGVTSVWGVKAYLERCCSYLVNVTYKLSLESSHRQSWLIHQLQVFYFLRIKEVEFFSFNVPQSVFCLWTLFSLQTLAYSRIALLAPLSLWRVCQGLDTRCATDSNGSEFCSNCGSFSVSPALGAGPMETTLSIPSKTLFYLTFNCIKLNSKKWNLLFSKKITAHKPLTNHYSKSHFLFHLPRSNLDLRYLQLLFYLRSPSISYSVLFFS